MLGEVGQFPSCSKMGELRIKGPRSRPFATLIGASDRAQKMNMTGSNGGSSSTIPPSFRLVLTMIHDLRIHDFRIHDLRIHDLRIHDLRIHDLRIRDLRIRDLRIHDLRIHDLRIRDVRIHDLRIHDLRHMQLGRMD